MIDFNINPYFDDFDEENNFYRVLFKPGYAVQARELNQLQSILQNQVSSVGNHIFKKNSMVIPGGMTLNQNAEIIVVNGSHQHLVGKTITNSQFFDIEDSSTIDGVIAVVLAVSEGTNNNSYLHVKYYRPSLSDDSRFLSGDTIYTVERTPRSATIATGGILRGKVATISKGVFFTKEIFVDVGQQSVIVDPDNTVVTNAIIGLMVEESIVTAQEDYSLFDNAIGSPNYNAPGADRYKISLRLVKLVGSVPPSDNFIEMMRIDNNVVTFLNDRTQYAELMKTLASRTFDTSGNFVVEGLETSITNSSSDKDVWINISPGKCYVGGYQYNQTSNVSISVSKPRSEDYQLSESGIARYYSGASFIYVSGQGLGAIPRENSVVTLYSVFDGNNIKCVGFGVFRGIQFDGGDVSSNTDRYRVFFDDFSIERGFTFSDIGCIKTSNGAIIPCLHKVSINGISGGNFSKGMTISSPDGSNSGVVYSTTNAGAVLYVLKNDPDKRVPTARIVSGGISATVSEYFITNFSPSKIPIIEVSDVAIRTLYGGEDSSNRTSYRVSQRNSFVIPSGSENFTISYESIYGQLGGSDTFDPSGFICFITDSGRQRFLDVGVSLESGDKSYSFTIPSSVDVTSVVNIDVISTVIRRGVQEAKKDVESAEDIIRHPSRSWMPLSNADIIGITKVVEGALLPLVGAEWDNGVISVQMTVPQTVFKDGVVVIQGATPSSYNGTYVIRQNSSGDRIFLNSASDPGTYESGGDISLPPDFTTDTDITSRFEMWGGNTSRFNGSGMVRVKLNETLPVGQIGIRYTYFSITGTSYISVDSYGNHGLQSSIDSGWEYISKIPKVGAIDLKRYLDFRTRTSSYFFKNLGFIAEGSRSLTVRDLNLSAFDTLSSNSIIGKKVVGPSHPNGTTIIDMRLDSNGDTVLILADDPPDLKYMMTDDYYEDSYEEYNLFDYSFLYIGDETDTYKSNPYLVNEYINQFSDRLDRGYFGNYYIGVDDEFGIANAGFGGVTFPQPKENTSISLGYTKFLPRKMMVYVDRRGDIMDVRYRDIQSLSEVVRDRSSKFRLPLGFINMKPFTESLSDIELTRIYSPAYTMNQIQELDDRIKSNFDYISRGITNKGTILSNTPANAKPLSIFSENFDNIRVQEFDNYDFSCTLHEAGYVTPPVYTRTIPMTEVFGTTCQKTGSIFSLKYTEVVALSNGMATIDNNINPFDSVRWDGSIRLTPSSDNWYGDSFVSASRSQPARMKEIDINRNLEVVSEFNTNTLMDSRQTPLLSPMTDINEVITKVENVIPNRIDSLGGITGISFNWETSSGMRGYVHTDAHLSPIISELGFDGTFANSIIGRLYNETDVKRYLNAGRHLDDIGLWSAKIIGDS